jgi:hypothetical protein
VNTSKEVSYSSVHGAKRERSSGYPINRGAVDKNFDSIESTLLKATTNGKLMAVQN